MNRRTFLTLASTVAAGATLQACAPVAEFLPGAPSPIDNSQLTINHWQFAFLSRLTYGPRLEERERAAEIGLHAWIEGQLDYENVEDVSAEFRIRPFDAIRLRADELDGWEPEDAIHQFKAATMLRRIYSRRQLYEIMVEFWTDHFNISVRKDEVWMLKPTDDREVIRPNALGNFRDLLHASAKSPAMLVYLDNQANLKDAPNENYAREVMELHTLGVDGGYTQNDVQELARTLTGWGVKKRWWPNEFRFNPDEHDDGVKTILGREIRPNGIHETTTVLDMLASHPSTAHHIATKLVRRFITDDPQRDAPALVGRTAQTFLETDGDIKAVLKTVLHDGLVDRETPLPRKFKRPVHFITSALRMTNAQTNAPEPLHRAQAAMGQADYEWPTPDGPPDYASAWRNNLLPRWRLALTLARNEINWTELGLNHLVTHSPSHSDLLNTLSNLILGHAYPVTHRDAVLQTMHQTDFDNETDAANTIIAGLIASPAFQWR